MFENIKLPWKTKIDVEEKDNKAEQESLEKVNEPETKIIDIRSQIDYLGIYSDDYSDVSQLIDTYRDMASNFEISEALDEIENDAVVVENDESISYNTDRLEMPDKIKKDIEEEFDNILKLLDWNAKGYSLFRQWFVDARLYQQKIMHKNTKEGIKKIVALDPKKIKRFKKKDTKEIYYTYHLNKDEKYSIPGEGITYTPSGILDQSHCFYISELHKSIRPLNNYRLMWDSALIYYITRAPQKRAFYIDVGNSPTAKGEEKVKKIMQKFRQRISYDSTSGKIVQQKRSIPVNEDYYFATRGDSRGTKIETIEGDTNLLDPEIMSMYKKQLYKSLGVPFARVDEDSAATIDFSNSGELSRQELKMSKQTKKRRKRFSLMFDDLLKTQLIAKKIISIDDWKEIKYNCFYQWKNDSYITMTKENEILSKQIELADEIEQYVGKYFPNDYVRKNIFKQTDQDIEMYDKQIDEEKNDERYKTPEEDADA